MAGSSLTEGLAETLALFDGPGTPWTTTEVAERLDLGRRSTYNRLDRLVDRGELETKKVGASARVWWRPAPSGAVDSTEASPDWPAAAESLIDDVLERAEVGVFVLDRSFDVVWINDATERYFGLERERVVGRDKRRLVEEPIASAVEDPGSFRETVLATYEDNTDDEEFECHVLPGDGREERWLEHRSRPIESGAYAGGRVELYYDVTGRERSERARRGERESLELLADAVEEYAIFTLDPDGRVETWNSGAARITGYEEAEVVGEHVSTFYTGADVDDGVPGEALAAAAREGSVEDEGWRVRKDGSRYRARATLSAVEDADGDLHGYVKIHRDVTDDRERERRLRRERNRSEERYRTLFESLDQGYCIVEMRYQDGEPVDYRFLETNPAFEEQTGLADAEGRWMREIEPDHEQHWFDVYGEVARTGEPVRFEARADALMGGWYDVYAFQFGDPGDDTVAVLFDDVTERKERERELEESEQRYRTLVDNFPNGIVTLFDEDFSYLVAGGELYETFDRSPDETVGKTLYERGTPEEVEILEPHYEATLDGESRAFEVEYDGRTIQFQTVPVTDETGDVFAGMAMSQDVTERKERERELEEYRRWNQTLIENFPAGAVALVDEELRYVTFAGTPGADVTREDLEGAPVGEALPPRMADVVLPRYEAALDGEASAFVDTVDDRVYQFHFVPVRDDDGDVFAATAMSQDVTERLEREEELRDAKLQLEAATEAGAVGTWEWHVQEDRLVAGPSFAKTFGVDPDAAREGVSLDEFLSAIHEEDRNMVERRVEEAVSTCGEYEAEYRVRDADGEVRWVVARGHVQCDEDGEPVSFPGALTDITELKRAERELERQREQLAALNSLNEVFQDITDAVIERSTREEIEAAVCEGLASIDSFAFAWIGEANPATETLRPRTEAGVEGYLDGATISLDQADERSRGPGGRAFLTREVQVARDVRTDLDYEPWRDHVEAHGVRSIAGVPIVHDDRIYGVLAVYAERPDAFAEAERRLLGQLGEVVGHAIAAVERKRALMSDEVVELEFRITDVFAAADVDGEFDGRISLERAVPASGSEFLVYGTATEGAWPGFLELADALPHWDDLSRLGEAPGGVRRFELRLSEPPMLSVVASLGGYVETALIEEGDCRLVIHLPPTGNVAAVSDAVTDAYPTAELLAQRQFTRDGDAVAGLERLIQEGLTVRQRAALESAFHSGFFEWPRAVTGEEVAETLGVAPPTFHQHLRKAERKVFESVLSGTVRS